jgi:hypothetical protein
MKRALSLLDSQDISAEEFDRMERPWQEERRHLMFWLACGKKATFRIVSSNGVLPSAHGTTKLVYLVPAPGALSSISNEMPCAGFLGWLA